MKSELPTSLRRTTRIPFAWTWTQTTWCLRWTSSTLTAKTARWRNSCWVARAPRRSPTSRAQSKRPSATSASRKCFGRSSPLCSRRKSFPCGRRSTPHSQSTTQCSWLVRTWLKIPACSISKTKNLKLYSISICRLESTRSYKCRRPK